jgi:histidyl-tRNA synthetase
LTFQIVIFIQSPQRVGYDLLCDWPKVVNKNVTKYRPITGANRRDPLWLLQISFGGLLIIAIGWTWSFRSPIIPALLTPIVEHLRNFYAKMAPFFDDPRSSGIGFMKNIIQPVKGTRDFYPEEMALRAWLYETIRQVSEAFGYQEYDGPFLEPVELYAAKSGEELVNQQSFVFPDRGGDLITLRPELTPTLARMVAQRQRQLVYPLRWWSWGPMWRYERPQKGRSREFFQWNIDLIGVSSPEADAELIAVAATFFQRVGLRSDQVNLLVNDRRLMDGEFAALGIPPEERSATLRLVDRRDKMRPEEWEAYAVEIGLAPAQLSGLKAILANNQLWEKSEGLNRLFAALEALRVKEYVRFSPQVIRGLDYYTGTVVEAWDCDGEFRAILGGGRYDNLVADVGGEPLPGVGFAMGDMVVSLVLKKFAVIPDGLEQPPARVMVTVFDETTQAESLSLSAELRQAGINVTCYPEAGKLSRQFKYADRLGMRLLLVIGPDELTQGGVTLKDLKTGTQQTIPRDRAVAEVSKTLAQPLSS